MKLLLSIFIVAFAQQISAQDPRFILGVMQDANDVMIFRCIATAFTTRHALTTAACADAPGIVLQGRELNLGGIIPETTTIFRLTDVFIHPEYNTTVRRANNVAVLRTQNEMVAFSPRVRSSLLTNRNYQFFAWGTALPDLLFPRFINIQVYAPIDCSPPLTPLEPFGQAFCAILPNNQSDACNLPFQGSPVLWSNLLVGILISEGGCTPHGNQFALNFHNVDEFRTWIDQVSAAEMTKVSAILILSALISCVKILF